jgi:hypothetical protein
MSFIAPSLYLQRRAPDRTHGRDDFNLRRIIVNINTIYFFKDLASACNPCYKQDGKVPWKLLLGFSLTGNLVRRGNGGTGGS